MSAIAFTPFFDVVNELLLYFDFGILRWHFLQSKNRNKCHATNYNVKPFLDCS